MSADDAVCPMHGAREPYTWGYSSKEPGCTCPETTPDETVSTDGAPFGYDQSHDQTPDDAARAEADRLWFSGEHGSPVDWRGGYVRGRADERAQAEGAGSSLSTQEGYEWLVDHDKKVRAHERARIAARRDEADRDACPWDHAARGTKHDPDGDIACNWSKHHTDAVLAALGVDR